jgi:hypothetical protein
MAAVRKGQKVVGASGQQGTTTGGKRKCPSKGCPGQQVAVRWDDGTLSYCCSNEMTFKNDVWRIK